MGSSENFHCQFRMFISAQWSNFEKLKIFIRGERLGKKASFLFNSGDNSDIISVGQLSMVEPRPLDSRVEIPGTQSLYFPLILNHKKTNFQKTE